MAAKGIWARMNAFKKCLGLGVLLPTTLMMAGCPQKTASASTPPPPQTTREQPVHVPAGVMAGRIRSAGHFGYPPEALKKGIQGVVRLHCVISKTGRVEDVRVISSDSPLLTKAAIRAVSDWKYRPYYSNGKPVPVTSMINVVFRIPKDHHKKHKHSKG